jgi:hypothetical protein
VPADETPKTTTGRRRRLAPVATAAAGLVVGVALVGTGMAAEDEPVADPAETMEREPLPTGSEVEGRDGAETSAERLVAALDAVARAEDEPCDPDDLVVQWHEPAAEPENGAWVEPLGPPAEGEDEGNGIVACRGSDHEVAGFQAQYEGGRWSVALVPDLGHDDGEVASSEQHTGDQHEQAAAGNHEADEHLDDEEAADDEAEVATPAVPDVTEVPDVAGAEVPDPGDVAVLPGTGDDPNVLAEDSRWRGLWDEIAPDIEPLASYEPQQVCSPSAKPGANGFRNLVLQAYPMTGDSGISRACGQGGRSEHKEGRAWDWSANVHDPEERQAAAEVIGWLLATDEHGNEHAMARRLGVMYVIYNGNIWSSYDADAGWRPYVGRSDHTDHVHISFNEAGGLGQTSFWDVPGLEELANSRFGPAAILPEYGGGIGYELTSPEEGSSPAGGAPGMLSPPVPPPSSSQPGGGGGGGAPGPTPSSPGPTAPPPLPPPPSLPPVTLPPITLPQPPDLGPIDDLLCGLLPCVSP